jgi:hypothetical protein
VQLLHLKSHTVLLIYDPNSNLYEWWSDYSIDNSCGNIKKCSWFDTDQMKELFIQWAINWRTNMTPHILKTIDD